MYFLTLSGHLIGNYYLKYIPFMREKGKLALIIIQSLIYSALLTAIFSLFLPMKYILFGAIVTMGVHFTIDLLHHVLLTLQQGKRTGKKWMLGLEIGDLFLHILFFYLFHFLFQYSENIALKSWANEVLHHLLFLKSNYPLSTRINILFGYLFLMTPSSFLMRYALLAIFPDGIYERERDNIGSIIGNIERIIVFTLSVMDLYPSIALVITAKSLARFKQLEDRSFAERYLIGTLLSFLIALLVAFFLFS